MTGNSTDTQVVVVGAGPVGLLLAGELRLGGVDVVVVERLLEPTGESRASQLNARTMEVFDQRGLLARLGETQSEPAGHFGGIGLDVSDVPSVHAGYWKVPQFRTEDMLTGWAIELGADIRRGHELTGLTSHADHVDVDVIGDGGPVRLRAEYVVGCDGEQSTVRQLAGFDFPGTSAVRELIRADVRDIDIPPKRFQRFDKGLAIAQQRDGITRVMFHTFGRAAGARTEAPRFAEVVGEWARITGEDISGGTPVWVDAFDDTSRQAARYRKDRILLAGDAAHVQMPAGGQALNLGVQDVANLGWKLAAQVNGWAPDGLLDSYHDERHPVGVRILTDVRAQTQLLLGGPEVNAVRTVFGELLQLDDARAHLAITLSGVDVRYPVGTGTHALLGARLPHSVLGMDSGSTSTTELLHTADGVLLDLTGRTTDAAELRAMAAAWEPRVRVVRARADRGSALSNVDAVLVRPDGHIAWIDGGATELDAALRRWFGDPAVPTHTAKELS
ncbi:MAG TPA: FAD-dependent monooxygenase [Pseudonocardiaceae bacterium]|nr:FAD-dependent monooxygenase [Pseudonocardiaceae bacterium]